MKCVRFQSLNTACRKLYKRRTGADDSESLRHVQLDSVGATFSLNFSFFRPTPPFSFPAA